ncbi:MAG: hypothetical protein JW709_02625, partial [Sedimentisphaerales bacterium]|nr:hypothetical protein [Sedimentisphaerales bacterium]
FIRDYFIQLKKGSADTIAGWVQLDGENLKQEVAIIIPEIDLTHTGKADKNGRLAFECKAKGLELWSPQHPKLYDVVLESGQDRITDRIGFRTLETRGTQILLNGKPIFLRGISVHDEIAVQRGRVTSRGDALRIVNDALELGCNFIRLAHYPHNEHTIRVADEKGLLVWSEIPVYWAIQFENPQTYELAEQMLTEMITRDKNRACVAFWSMMNETQFTDARLEFIRKLIAKTRHLDDTRLIAAATYPHRLKNGHYTVKDPLMGDLDVIGCNQYIGWYIGNPPDAASITWEKPIDKPLIFSELGGAALAGYHADDETAWSEEFQETIYRSQVEMIKRVDFLAGMSPWALYDFREPNRGLLKEQDKHNRKGIISNRGQYKKAYYVLRNFYHELAEKE